MRIVGQISSNITFSGQYKMEGRGLNLLTLTGSDQPRFSRNITLSRVGRCEDLRHEDDGDE